MFAGEVENPMNSKRWFELACGLLSAILGIVMTITALYVTGRTAAVLEESPQLAKAFSVAAILYGLPGCMVALGSYAHAVKGRRWGQVLLILATLFLTVWFFLTVVLLLWSGFFVPVALLTGFAALSSISSLF